MPFGHRHSPPRFGRQAVPAALEAMANHCLKARGESEIAVVIPDGRTPLPQPRGPGQQNGTVKAAYIEDFCDASGIRYGELPDPAPGPGEVLVRVAAVAVNKVDTFVRSGAWRTPAVFQLVVGRDLAGTVTAAGAGVGDMRAGDRVWANTAGYGGRPGATAELAVVGRDRLSRSPGAPTRWPLSRQCIPAPPRTGS